MVPLSSTYWDMYPRNDDVVVEQIEKLSKGVGIRLILRSDRENFTHFLYSINTDSFRKSTDGKVQVRFKDIGFPQIVSAKIAIKAVSKDGKTSKTYSMLISYYSREWYALYDRDQPSQVIVHKTDLLFAKQSVKNLIFQHPTRDDKKYAERKWGHLILPDRSTYENATALARALLDSLESHRGVPSEEMYRLLPFEQYERVLSGKDMVECRNIAALFSYACNALGIPCRSVCMANQTPMLGDAALDYQVGLAPNHTANEIFSKELNQWIWMDLFLYALGAQPEDKSPANIVEFQMLLNHPNWVQTLHTSNYNPVTKQAQTLPVIQSAQKDLIWNYYNRDQQFYFLTTAPKKPVL